MASASDRPFQVDRVAAVDRQIRAPAQRAKAVGVFDDYLEALKETYDRLSTDPHKWGDPELNTRVGGGVVFHAICRSIYVRYLVYQTQRWILIRNIKAIPHTPLDDV